MVTAARSLDLSQSLDPRVLFNGRRWDITGGMSRSIFLASWLLTATSAFAQIPEFTLQGLITVDKPAKSIRVVLQDPKEKNVEVASVDASKHGNYEIRGLQKRSYRLVTVIDGKKQDRRDLE